MSFAYLRLLIFLPAIWIPACDSFSPGFCMALCIYVNKQDNNIPPCHTPFSILSQSVVPSSVLTVASWPTCMLLRRKVRRSAICISKNFLQLYTVTHTQRFKSSQRSRSGFFFFWISVTFSMIQWILTIWFLDPLPLLNPAVHLELLSSHTAEALLEGFGA